ncbi:MAG: hypothetical protein IH599_04475, partial [Bacteroidales bacterium]|nr:hypothetical protein [Bacteroidales bacterium]
MKKLLLLITWILVIFLPGWRVQGQCAVTAMGYPLEICRGEPVTLTAAGACGYLMMNDFNNGTIGLGWSSNASPMFNNPCPPTIPPATGIVCWIGSATNFPRQLTTIAYNLSIGSNCVINFDMKYGDIQTHTDCEDPDEPDEGVHLQ